MPSPPSSSTNGAQRAARLLVVDDDLLSGTLQFHLAALLGHVATVETDAEHAIDLAMNQTFDVMLLDLSMPRLDGFAALRLLREREAASARPALPVIAVTGYASNEDRLRCLTAGFADHLSKPVQVSALKAAIERAITTRATLHGVDATASPTDAERLQATVRRLGAIRPDERAFTPTITESFALRSAQLIDAIRNAVRDDNLPQATRAAEALKSSAEFLGATRLAAMSAEIEDACAAGDLALVKAGLPDVEHEHQAVLTLLFQASAPR